MDNENTNQTPESAPTIRLKPIVIKPRTGAPTDADAAKPSIPGVVPRVVASQPAPAAAPAEPGMSVVQNWDGKEKAPVVVGSAPAAEAPAAVEAAKSKTSRISLDAALVGGEVRPTGPKTIRLKRPTGVSIPGAATVTPAAAHTGSDTGTLKLKKTEPEASAGAITFEGGEGNIVLSGGAGSGGAEKVNILFPLVAAASIIVLAATMVVLGGWIKL